MQETKFTKRERDEILTIARKSIENIDYDTMGLPALTNKRGVFVTLYKKGRLRGCMGLPYPEQTIEHGVKQAAKMSAFEDPRFSPIDRDEPVNIEVTILSPPERIPAHSFDDILDSIELGRDGLIVESGNKSALFLPQVPIEHQMTKLDYYESLCDKAGIDHTTCKNMEKTRVFSFRGEIISEKE